MQSLLENLVHLPAPIVDLFENQNAVSDAAQIPIIDIQHPPESFPHGTLVTFNGMVQDTSISPELYLVNRDILKECNVFWVVSIPGQSPWSTTEIDPADHFVSHSPLQSHKYPIPHKPHIGVQVKVR